MESDGPPQTTCPYCHTAFALMSGGARAAGDWRCLRCGQRWDARRLATVAAYASWALDHEKPVRARPRPWDDLGADGLEVHSRPGGPSAV
jgi:tRNA(Ile2) C34 agmatinyltransferase TiaS